MRLNAPETASLLPGRRLSGYGCPCLHCFFFPLGSTPSSRLFFLFHSLTRRDVAGGRYLDRADCHFGNLSRSSLVLVDLVPNVAPE